MFLFVPWTSTLMSNSWKANSFQDCSLIRNQLKMGTFVMHSTKLKQLFMSSKDETYTKATGTWPTEDKGTTCWHLPFCWLPLLPCSESDLLYSQEENQQFSKSLWIFHVLKTNGSSGTSTFSYTLGSLILGQKFLSSSSSTSGNVFFSSVFQNWFFLTSFLLILHRIPESNNRDIKGGSHYMLTCKKKSISGNACFRLKNSEGQL